MPGLTWAQREPVWLLDLTIAGHVFRYATQPARVVTAAGATVLYAPGLAPLDIGSSRILGAYTVTIKIDGARADWAKLAARGIGFDNRAATVRLWFPGQALEAARVYASGVTSRARWGAFGDALTLTLTDDPSRGALTLPDGQAAATSETWPVRAGYVLPEPVIGQPYPVVIGYPGDHPKPGATDIAEPAVKAVYVEREDPYSAGTGERYVIAFGDIDAAKVQLYDYELITGDFSAAQPATAESADALGRRVTHIEHALLNMPETGEIWVGFRNAASWGGGLLSPYSGEVLRGAGEVLRYFFDYFSDAQIDHGRMIAAGADLDRYKIDAAILEPANVVNWITDNILGWLQVIGVNGASGFYFAPLRWDATGLDAVAHLSADNRQIARDGEIRLWGEPIYNSFRVQYRPVRGGETYASNRTLSSIDGALIDAVTAGANLPPFATSLPWQATSERDSRIWGSALCRASQAQFGVRELAITLNACWDDSTAALILQGLAARYAWPKREASYTGGIELASIEPGDVVTVTDSEVSLSAAPAIVIERETRTSGVTLSLVILDSPLGTLRRRTS